jgi:hypothetical protein
MNASRHHSLIVAFAFVFFVASALSQSASSGVEPSSMHDQLSSSGHRDLRERNMSKHTRPITVVSHPPRFPIPSASVRLSRS